MNNFDSSGDAERNFRAQVEAHDWSRSPLGPRRLWPSHLRVVVELILDARQPMFLTWGNAHTFIFNEAFAEILGDESLQALGASLPELWAGAWEHMGHYFDDAIAGRGALLEDQLLPTWASGYEEFRYFSFSYTPIRHDGAVHGVICVCNDTTDKVRAQERVRQERDALSRAFEQAPGFIAMSEGKDHRFIVANAAYRRLVGNRDVVGETVAEALPEIVGQGFIALLDKVIETGQPFTAQAMPVRLRTSAGTEEIHFVDFVYAPRAGAEGQIVGVFCEGQDVTGRIKSAKQISDLQAELIHASRGNAMNVMASTLAHELNQPLTSISSYAEAACRFLEAGKPDDAVSCLKGVAENTARAGDIIRSARQLVERRTVSNQAVPIKATIQEVVHILGASSCQIRINLEPDLTVGGDKVQIQQVFLNLLRNACESHAGSSPLVEVTACISANRVLISVSDNGAGISIEPIDSIFDAFSTSKTEGMGLGLAICRTIVEAHGGRIWAENGPGPGATVHCDLPRHEDAAAI